MEASSPRAGRRWPALVLGVAVAAVAVAWAIDARATRALTAAEVLASLPAALDPSPTDKATRAGRSAHAGWT